jgi:hypothetical protein
MMDDQSDMKMDRDSTTDALLSINSLKYTLPEQLSVVTARSTQKYPSLSQDHQGGSSTIYYRCETGARFVDGRNSWIRLQLSVTGPTTAKFASGSIANCIRSVVIRSASGVEIDRVQHFNVLNRNLKRWQCPSDYFSGALGKLQGWDDDTDLTTAPTYYYIKLSDLSGFFDNSKLLPSMVMSGLQIELELESPSIAFESTGPTPASYTLQGCELFTDCFQLSDSIARKMNQLASQGGLELSYVSTSGTFTAATQSRFSINANLSVSRALHTFAISTLTSDLVGTGDSFKCVLGDSIDNYQYRVGSLYMPQAPVQGKRDSLIQTLHSFDKLRNCHQSSTCAVTYDSYDGSVGDVQTSAVGATLERSSVLNLSGIPINQSRALVLDIAFTGTAVSRVIYNFVSYQKAATVFLQNVVIKE